MLPTGGETAARLDANLASAVPTRPIKRYKAAFLLKRPDVFHRLQRTQSSMSRRSDKIDHVEHHDPWRFINDVMSGMIDHEQALLRRT